MKINFLSSAILVTAWCLAASACSNAGDTKNQQDAAAKASPAANAQSIEIYSGQVKPGLRVVIESPAAQQELTGIKADVPKVAGSSAPNAEVTVFKSLKNSEGDALTFSWKDSWRASLNFDLAAPINLTDYMADGVVELDMNIIQLAKGGLSFKAKCGSTCDRQIPFLLSGRELAGKAGSIFLFHCNVLRVRVIIFLLLIYPLRLKLAVLV